MNARNRHHAIPILTTANWQTWEMRRYILEHETPGRFGYFTAADEAA